MISDTTEWGALEIGTNWFAANAVAMSDSGYSKLGTDIYATGKVCHQDDAVNGEYPVEPQTEIVTKMAHPKSNSRARVKVEKETPNTHCQICGRPILANTGKIAHHGYKRPGNGWQTKSCLGARFEPYEVSRDRIPYAISVYETFVAKQQTDLDELIANPPATLTYTRGSWTKETKTVEKPAGFDPNKDYYATSPYSYESCFADKKREHEQNIKYAKEDISFLKDRYEK